MPDSIQVTTAKWDVQVRKGVLEFIILLLLQSEERYGYELISAVTQTMEFELTEGTIYPLLSRLHKDGLLTAQWVEVDGGVPRKYYRLSPRGEDVLEAMQLSWQRLMASLQRLVSAAARKRDGLRVRKSAP